MAYVRPLARVASPRVLVVGGGIAGIQAALEAAAVGLPVTLVEEGPALGGLMAQLDKTFPTNDCAMCILSPMMLAMARHPGIEILSLTRVLEMAGEPGDFRVLLSRRPRYVEEDRCSGCGECVRVCPRKIPDPYNLGLTETKAIRVPFPQAVPQAAFISPEVCRAFQGKPAGPARRSVPAGAINFQQAPEEWVLAAGAVILAPGSRPAPARDFPGYDHPDVVTSLEFERLLSATGPHGGRLRRPSDQAEPGSIAFIQCVGSRDLAQGRGLLFQPVLPDQPQRGGGGPGNQRRGGGVHRFLHGPAGPGQGARKLSGAGQGPGGAPGALPGDGVAPGPEAGSWCATPTGGAGPGRPPSIWRCWPWASGPGPSLPGWARRLKVDLNEHGFIKAGALDPGAAPAGTGSSSAGRPGSPWTSPRASPPPAPRPGAAAQLLTVSLRIPAPRPKPPAGGRRG